MKILRILPLMFLTGCASEPKPFITHMKHDVPGTTLPSEDVESVRYSENIKAYNVGRYIDPNNRLMMHEAHPVYRVETTAKWNLHPNGPALLAYGPALKIIDTAHKDSPTTPEIAAEINKQKAATETVIQQGERINQTLTQLSTALTESRQASEQNGQLRKELDLTKQRLDLLETELRGRQQTNAVPQNTSQTETW